MDEEIQLINGNENFSYCRNIIGWGRTSNVYRGKYNGQDVAVKRIVIDVKENLADLSSEINILSKLKHAHIVEFLHSEKDEIFRFLVFELCDTDLRQYVKLGCESRVTNQSDEIKVILQLSEALQFIHSKELIHNDIKPENILVSNIDSSVNMKWTDFGNSKRSGALMGELRGTKCWMAREIIQITELTARSSSDIFSAGCVFFFFLTNGVHPFGDEKEDSINLEQNIINGNMINRDGLNEGHRAKRTVIRMMEDRLGLEEVISELENALPNP